MRFKFHLALAYLPLMRRQLRVWLSAMLVRFASLALAASKSMDRQTAAMNPIAPPQPATAPQFEPFLIKCEETVEPLHVHELLTMAQRWHGPVFTLRLPDFLIEIYKINGALEKAAFSAGGEGHPTPRRARPFFARHCAEHDKTT